MARKTTVTLSLDTEADKDILRWLERQANRSAAIREAIRSHLNRGEVTIADVYQVIKKLERKLQAGAVAAIPLQEMDDWPEPPEAVAALDALANLG